MSDISEPDSETSSCRNLTALQTDSYASFLQDEVDPKKRKDQGLEGVLREIFPIESYDKTTLEYLHYDWASRATPARSAGSCG